MLIYFCHAAAYKYIIIEKDTKKLVRWEGVRGNRTVPTDKTTAHAQDKLDLPMSMWREAWVRVFYRLHYPSRLEHMRITVAVKID